jgi:hypothetical protein
LYGKFIETQKYNLDSVVVQKVRWDKYGIKPAGDYIYFMKVGVIIVTLWQAFLVHDRILLSVKRAEFFSDRLSCIILRGVVADKNDFCLFLGLFDGTLSSA